VIARDPDLTGDLAVRVGPFALSPLDHADVADLFGEFSDPQVVEYMDIEPLIDIEQAAEIVRWSANLRALGAGIRWAIRERESGHWVGSCGFNALVVDRGRRGEIAYDLARPWQRRGVMLQILPAIIEFGFGRLALHRLEATVTPGNARSCRLLERHGFIQEGVLRGYGYWKGRYWDQIVYGLTREP